MIGQNKNQDESQPKIQRARYDSLCLYEVSDGELELLEKGSPNSTLLNFGSILLSVGLSFLIPLFTIKIESLRVFCIFVIISTIGILLGAIFLFLWWRNRNDFSALIVKIKSRLKSS